MGGANVKMIIGKQKIRSEMRKTKDTIPSNLVGKVTSSPEILKLPRDGRRTTVDTWIQ